MSDEKDDCPLAELEDAGLDVEHGDDCPRGKGAGGPSKVNSRAYLDGWTRIFDGSKLEPGDA